jgi:hypothetical protein
MADDVGWADDTEDVSAPPLGGDCEVFAGSDSDDGVVVAARNGDEHARDGDGGGGGVEMEDCEVLASSDGDE